MAKEKINGNEELAKAIEKLNVNLVSLVAETSIWATPEICEQLKKETGCVAWYPQVRRGRSGEKKGDKINGITIDDNTYANNTIKMAVGLKREDITDYETCHIWRETCYDERYHTAVPNLVLIPRAIASLSDHSEQIIEALKYRSYELYKWYPEETAIPQMPNNYPNNWREFLRNDRLKISKIILREQEDEVLFEVDEDNYLDKIKKEIGKIKNRVPKYWFPKPTQINSTILITFMRLRSKSKTQFVSRKELKEVCSTIEDFYGNFNQMAHFGENNHGKVFEVDGDNIRLWEPVEKIIIDEWNKYPEFH